LRVCTPQYRSPDVLYGTATAALPLPSGTLKNMGPQPPGLQDKATELAAADDGPAAETGTCKKNIVVPPREACGTARVLLVRDLAKAPCTHPRAFFRAPFADERKDFDELTTLGGSCTTRSGWPQNCVIQQKKSQTQQG